MARVDIPMIGRQFGLLRVVERAEKGNQGHRYFRCVCACGGVHEHARGTDLRTGKTKSCGCIKRNVGPRHMPVREPTKGHPLIRLLFRQINVQQVSMAQLEKRSGIRTENLRLMRDGKRRLVVYEIEAALNALGFEIVAREKE